MGATGSGILGSGYQAVKFYSGSNGPKTRGGEQAFSRWFLRVRKAYRILTGSPALVYLVMKASTSSWASASEYWTGGVLKK